ncbi:MAG: PhzF family phenazine biosynthesis protein [Firmicutes bacterium]|nr:PhzF family phenazine biosynthesis protein [Bacillota bacterium]
MKYFIVDAFTDKQFAGNPAGVCLLPKWLDSKTMQIIAAENNLSETAFIVRQENKYELRWFTPEIEVDLCGHATLASAFVIFNFVDQEARNVCFSSKSGLLNVTKRNNMYEMDFPARKPIPTEISLQISQAIGMPVLEAHAARDLLLLMENEKLIRDFVPNFELLKEIQGYLGIIITAQGDNVDFVSRFFTPNAGVPEDPVTGSTHSSLIPFWADRLGKAKMTAKQLSKRGGTLLCENCGDRVKISGNAVLYLRGEIAIE